MATACASLPSTARYIRPRGAVPSPSFVTVKEVRPSGTRSSGFISVPADHGPSGLFGALVAQRPRELVRGFEQEARAVLAQDRAADCRYRHAHGRDPGSGAVSDRPGEPLHPQAVFLVTTSISTLADHLE